MVMTGGWFTTVQIISIVKPGLINPKQLFGGYHLRMKCWGSTPNVNTLVLYMTDLPNNHNDPLGRDMPPLGEAIIKNWETRPHHPKRLGFDKRIVWATHSLTFEKIYSSNAPSDWRKHPDIVAC